MTIGAVSLGLLSLLGVGAGLSALSFDKVGNSASVSESIFSETQKMKENREWLENYADSLNVTVNVDPPISSSESSRPNNSNNKPKFSWKPVALGVGSGFVGGMKVADELNGEPEKTFNWGLVIGLVGGVILVRKFFK